MFDVFDRYMSIMGLPYNYHHTHQLITLYLTLRYTFFLTVSCFVVLCNFSCIVHYQHLKIKTIMVCSGDYNKTNLTKNIST